MGEPVLVVLAGLPGVGKSSLARELAQMTGLFHLRVDAMEAPFLVRGLEVEGSGYEAMAAVARENLALGLGSIIDCVNPWPLTREMFTFADVPHRRLAVEVFCSDGEEHGRRMEARGLPLSALERQYVPFMDADLRLDSAEADPLELAQIVWATLRP